MQGILLGQEWEFSLKNRKIGNQNWWEGITKRIGKYKDKNAGIRILGMTK